MTAPILTLAEVQALSGFTDGPWRMSIENGGGIVAGNRHAIVSAYSSPLGWPCTQVEQASRPLVLAAPALHATCLHLHAEVARLTAELSKPVARGWCQSEVTERAHRDVGDYAASVRTEVTPDGPPWGWKIWHKVTFEVLMSGPETGDAGKRAADLALVAAGYRLIGGVHPLPSEVSDGR